MSLAEGVAWAVAVFSVSIEVLIMDAFRGVEMAWVAFALLTRCNVLCQIVVGDMRCPWQQRTQPTYCRQSITCSRLPRCVSLHAV